MGEVESGVRARGRRWRRRRTTHRGRTPTCPPGDLLPTGQPRLAPADQAGHPPDAQSTCSTSQDVSGPPDQLETGTSSTSVPHEQRQRQQWSVLPLLGNPCPPPLLLPRHLPCPHHPPPPPPSTPRPTRYHLR